MARFKIEDRVTVIVTIGSIYNKSGIITDYAQMQYAVSGQCYPVPSWKVRLDDGECISISEKYLSPDRRGKT